MRAGLAWLAAVGIAAASGVGGAQAAELKVLCSNGLREVVLELAPQFERATGHKLDLTFGLAAAFKQKIEDGEPFDVAVLTPAFIDETVKLHKVSADTRAVIARAGNGLAIRAGAPRPDISTPEAFKVALINARSIAYAKAGQSGVYFVGLIDRLGIADAINVKSRAEASGVEVGAAVARGDAELGVLPVSEILPIKGVQLLGPFPGRAAGLRGDGGRRRHRRQGPGRRRRAGEVPQVARAFFRDQAEGHGAGLKRRLFEFEHDLFRKPVTTPGSSPGAGFFAIMLSRRTATPPRRAARSRRSPRHTAARASPAPPGG